MAIQRMRMACWIPKSTNTHSEHVILCDFLLQHWSHEWPPCYITVHCLSCYLYITAWCHTYRLLGFLHFFRDNRPTWKYHLRFLPGTPICIMYKEVLTRIKCTRFPKISLCIETDHRIGVSDSSYCESFGVKPVSWDRISGQFRIALHSVQVGAEILTCFKFRPRSWILLSDVIQSETTARSLHIP